MSKTIYTFQSVSNTFSILYSQIFMGWKFTCQFIEDLNHEYNHKPRVIKRLILYSIAYVKHEKKKKNREEIELNVFVYYVIDIQWKPGKAERGLEEMIDLVSSPIFGFILKCLIMWVNMLSGTQLRRFNWRLIGSRILIFYINSYTTSINP